MNAERAALVADALRAVQAGEDPDAIVGLLSGEECVAAHNALWHVDQALGARWMDAGAPTPELLEPTSSESYRC